MSLMSGERQVAPTIDGIRRDHVARYEWAASVILPYSDILDFGCGIGYGSAILTEGDCCAIVHAVDTDDETREYARKHYSRAGLWFIEPGEETRYDAVVAFEVIEHLQRPEEMLIDVYADRLLASVPNEAVFPYASLNSKEFHKRHYTKAQFEELLTSCGWRVQGWYTQKGIDGSAAEVVPGDDGWTIIADCVR